MEHAHLKKRRIFTSIFDTEGQPEVFGGGAGELSAFAGAGEEADL